MEQIKLCGNIIRVYRREKPFTQIDNELILDETTSLKAIGLLCRMMSLHPDINISIGYLVRGSLEGKAAISSAINELIRKGYMVRVQIIERGRFRGCKYFICDSKEYLKKYLEENNLMFSYQKPSLCKDCNCVLRRDDLNKLESKKRRAENRSSECPDISLEKRGLGEISEVHNNIDNNKVDIYTSTSKEKKEIFTSTNTQNVSTLSDPPPQQKNFYTSKSASSILDEMEFNPVIQQKPLENPSKSVTNTNTHPNPQSGSNGQKKRYYAQNVKPVPPKNYEECLEHFLRNGKSQHEAIRFWRYYAHSNWYTNSGNPITNWRMKANMWKCDIFDKNNDNSPVNIATGDYYLPCGIKKNMLDAARKSKNS